MAFKNNAIRAGQPPEPTAGAFDQAASSYDAAFTATALGTRLRRMVWQRLDASLAECRRVLEIGCGTGEDAIHLARSGVHVVATDASPFMLRVAADKAEAAGCAKRIHFRCVPIEKLGIALAGERFDGVFSNFGAVNCVRDLGFVAGDVAMLLTPGARLVWVVMGRHVPWEWAWFLARGQWGKAFRRSRRGGTPWRGMQISYPTPGALSDALRPYFEPVRRSGLGIVLPPTYASGWLERSPRALAALARMEQSLQRLEPLAALADHYIFEARRLEERARA